MQTGEEKKNDKTTLKVLEALRSDLRFLPDNSKK